MLPGLFFAFILLPLTCLLLVGWLITRRKVFAQVAGVLWAVVVALGAALAITGALLTPRNLKKEDYYGWYVVDREYFPGRQADWQYNSLRFRITPGDSIYFYLTDKAEIKQIFRGRVTTTKYLSERLVLHMAQPTYHVLADNPTTYRRAWSFRLVFHSSKFNNVYFKKGEWEPLAE